MEQINMKNIKERITPRFITPAEFTKKLEADPVIMEVMRRLADR